MDTKSYTTDNSFVNATDLQSGRTIEVEVVDRSNYTSTILPDSVESTPDSVESTPDSVESTPDSVESTDTDIKESIVKTSTNATDEPPVDNAENDVIKPHIKQLTQNTDRLIGGRNAPCPCGSGKKYKKCCLQ